MARELYERCTICAGTGRIDPGQWKGWRTRPRPGPDGKTECFACAGERFVKIGLTAGQVEKMVADLAARQREKSGNL